jgi:uncharacterized membrane protein YdjX (TVP38/TMEM64 family)
MGAKIGEKELDRHISKKRLAKVRRMLRTRGAVALAALDLIPPPFPFTPFVLAAGALRVNARIMFITLAVCRVFRFGIETYFAKQYGERIVAWVNSEVVRDAVGVCIVLAVGVSIVSIVKVVRASRPENRRRAAA